MYLKPLRALFLAWFMLAIASSAGAQLPPVYNTQNEDEFLPPEQAFVFSVQRVSAERYVAQWRIAQEYYLYRDKIVIKAKDSAVGYQSPQGIAMTDQFFGKTQVYRHSLSIPFSTKAQRAEFSYQGCADAGLCYPVQTQLVQLSDASLVTSAQDLMSTPQSEHEKVSSYLHDLALWLAILAFFGMGLLLALTPCVLPMVPVLSAVITLSAKPPSPKRAFSLSLAYVLAMAITFSIAGIIVASYGKNIHAWFQKPVVIIPFVATFVLLALAMLGTYQLRLPSALQTRLSRFGENRSGSFSGAIIMGSLSSLIVSPCVTPALIGALLFVAQSGDVATGGLALFSLGLGMGAPLLVVGTSLGKWMPRPGPMLDFFKKLFGFILFGFAIWMLDRIIADLMSLLLYGILLIAFSIYLLRLDIEKTSMQIAVWLVAAVIISAGFWLFTTAVLDSSSRLSATHSRAQDSAHSFQTFNTLSQVHDALAQAKQDKKPAMLVFYADWCISCQELEAKTFSDSRVQQLLSPFSVIEADVTDPNEHSEALLKHYALFGPPALLFFDTHGTELPWLRIVGFINAERFAQHLNKAFNSQDALNAQDTPNLKEAL